SSATTQLIIDSGGTTLANTLDAANQTIANVSAFEAQTLKAFYRMIFPADTDGDPLTIEDYPLVYIDEIGEATPRLIIDFTSGTDYFIDLNEL
ncbi:hypothetical protein LCGC14_2838680, partial [marine sediment metagenome]